MLQFQFLNNALSDFENTIQGVWAPVLQAQGIQILLAVGAIAFAVYAIQLLATHDLPTFILGFAYTIVSLSVLHAVFLYSQDLATDMLTGFQALGQQVSGLSPTTLTPSGVLTQGIHLVQILWAAAGNASWFKAPTVAIETMICVIVMVFAFAVASIIYLLALVEVWALIIGGSLLLAFAPLPWTWNIFPGWGLRVLGACVKTFFLIAVLALGLNEAAGWTTGMASTSSGLATNASLMMQAVTESLLFVALVYYIPGIMASLVTGGAGTAITAGETILAGMVAEGASQTASGGKAIGGATADAANAAADGAAKALKKVQAMLMR
jgi:P-type conjugative transfer protein TrbL